MRKLIFFIISLAMVVKADSKQLSQYKNEVERPRPRNPDCFIVGRCVKSLNVDESFEKNEIDCLKLCKSNKECSWFSFKYENNFCELMNNCTQLEETNLWISGSSSCTMPQCWIRGKCLGTVYHSEMTENGNACLALCKSNAGCAWFTFFGEFSECVLYQDCQSFDESCSRCVSGERNCLMEEKPLGLKFVPLS